MKCRLVVQQGTGPTQTIPIRLAQFVIGRDGQCNLRPLSPLISKRHCAILVRDGKACVRDFNSTNGTFLNGRRIDGQCEIHHGDLLRLGPLVFRFDTEPEPALEPPAETRPVDEDAIAALLLGNGETSAAGDITAQELPAVVENGSKREPGASGRAAARGSS